MKTEPNDTTNMDIVAVSTVGDVYLGSEMSLSTGLTKREYFAATAMQGLMSSQMNQDGSCVISRHQIASWAAEQADALIEALNEGSE